MLKYEIKKTVLVVSLLLFILFYFGGQASAQISFTSRVQDINKNPITDATITAISMDGAPIPIGSPAYDSSGNFTLIGLPSGTDFFLRFSKYGYRGTFTGSYNSTANIITAGYYTLYADTDPLWGLQMGKGVIIGRTYAQISPKIGYVNGVALTATSGMTPGKTYPVTYFDDNGPVAGATSTTGNGRFMVLNVDDMDTVTVTGTKTNWTGFQRTYKIFANSVSDGRVWGSTPSTISFIGTVNDAATSTPLEGVVVYLYGNSNIASPPSDPNGSFTLPGLPPATTFALKLTKSGYIPTYTRNVSNTVDFTNTSSYLLFKQQALTTWGVTSGKGVIMGRVIDDQSANIDGAVVTYKSSNHPNSRPYPVKYRDAENNFGGTSTYSNGRYYIFDVEEGDTVWVTASKAGLSFKTIKFVTHANAVSAGLITEAAGQGGGGGADITSISLSQGWNFVSFPKQPSDTAIGTALADVLSSVRIVWGFDNVNKVWVRYKPNAQNQTLNTLEAGKGYWICMSADGTIDLSTWTAASKTVSLSQGWNLVGYSGTNGALIDTALGTASGISGKWVIIWNWNTGEWSAKTADPLNTLMVPPLSTLDQGNAYWIRMKEGSAVEWTQ